MAKPTLALIPASQGSKVFSVLPSSGVGDFDFSRGGKATRINSQGLIEEVSNGQSRLDYPLIDGVVSGCPSLLLENSATNLYPYSNDVSFWSKSNVVTTSNYAISPDGTQNAFRAVSSSISSLLYITSTGTIGTNNTLSVWAKSNGGSSNKFRFFGNGTTIESNDYVATNEWQRFEFTYNCTAVTSGLTGASDSATNDILFYGFQHEAGSYATSYIPTNGTAVTRSAETANGAGDATTFNDSEGVLMAEINYQNIQTSWTGFGLTDGNASADRIIFATQTNTNNFKIYLQSGGTVRWNPNVVLNEINQFQKIAVKYKSNDVSLWMNGFEVASDNTVSIMPTGLNRLGFFGYSNVEPTYGKTKQIQYYNSALTDSELETLTSWTSFTDMANGQQYSII